MFYPEGSRRLCATKTVVSYREELETPNIAIIVVIGVLVVADVTTFDEVILPIAAGGEFGPVALEVAVIVLVPDAFEKLSLLFGGQVPVAPDLVILDDGFLIDDLAKDLFQQLTESE